MDSVFANDSNDYYTLAEIGNKAEIVHVFNGQAFTGSDEYHIIVLARNELISKDGGDPDYEYTFFIRMSALGEEYKYGVQVWFWTGLLLDKEDAVIRWESHIKGDPRMDKLDTAIARIQDERPSDWTELMLYLECMADIEQQDIDLLKVDDFKHLPIDMPTEEHLKRLSEFSKAKIVNIK